MERRGPLPEWLPALLAVLILTTSFARISKTIPASDGLSLSWALHGLLVAALCTSRVRLPAADVWGVASFGAFCLLGMVRGQWADVLSAGLVGLGLGGPSGERALRVGCATLAVLLGIHAIVFHLTLSPTPYTALQRFAGFTGDPNDLGVIAVLVTSPSWFALTRTRQEDGTRSLPRTLDVLAAVLGSLAVFASQSRIGVLALVVGVAWLSVALVRQNPKRGLVVVGVLALLVAFAQRRFWFRLFELLEGKDLGFRPFLIRTAGEAFAEHPWTGVGVGRFRSLAHGLEPHSMVLQAMAEGGLPHLFLGLVGGAAAWAAHVNRRDPWSWFGLMAVGLSAVGPMDSRVFLMSIAVASLVRSPHAELSSS